eukprot:Lithocolla_globosa_v1_NODE_11230_length_524_cov_48.202559.p1 type:complete len:144 gc:universal NODE_11230_length_524_cov_48.202559:82-513(+)
MDFDSNSNYNNNKRIFVEPQNTKEWDEKTETIRKGDKSRITKYLMWEGLSQYNFHWTTEVRCCHNACKTQDFLLPKIRAVSSSFFCRSRDFTNNNRECSLSSFLFQNKNDGVRIFLFLNLLQRNEQNMPFTESRKERHYLHAC